MSCKKRKVLFFVASILVNTVCCAASLMLKDFNLLRIIGSYLAFFVVFLVTFKMPVTVQISAYLFCLFASSLGSVLGLYGTLYFYDKIVHYISGIVLSYLGFNLGERTLYKRQIKDNGVFLKNLFAFFFSCSCAAFWEIYEFSVDNIFGMQSQGDNSNTMGDIIAGVLGALTFALITVIVKKLKKNKI